MSRKRKPPAYLPHFGPDGKKRARCIIRLPGRKPRAKLLGDYGSPESYAEHARLVALWQSEIAHLQESPGVSLEQPLDVNGLVRRFLAHVQRRYRRPDGSPGTEVKSFGEALRPLVRLHGREPLHTYGPKSLKNIVAAMVSGGWRKEKEKKERELRGQSIGWCRRVVNRHLWRIKLCFCWAESEELVPRGTHHSMLTVPSLAAGELDVRETDEVPPVAEDVLAETLPFLNPVVRSMVDTQLLTAMRPGELVRLRPVDLQRAGKVDLGKGIIKAIPGCWAYVPADHKTRWKNKRRVILFGPLAQAILQPLLENRPAESPVFCPAEAMKLFRAKQRRERKTRVQPSQRDRRSRSPRKGPMDRYSVGSYNRSVRRACEQAFPSPVNLRRLEGETKKAWLERLTEQERRDLKTWSKEHSWHVHQLRHNSASRICEQFDDEIARAILGHSVVDTTRLYALRDVKKAAEVIAKVG